MTGVSIALLVLSLIGALYYILSTCALVSHFRKGRKKRLPYRVPAPPKMSILKPVSGLDTGADANFDSYVRQDYGNYEVLFGVLDRDDSSIPVIERAISDLDHASVHTGAQIAGSNNKVRILHLLAQQATGDIVVVTDADTRVSPHFLRRIASPFANESVGVVTCMYRGIRARTIADALEGLHMTCVFAPGVACANRLRGIDFGLGAAIAIRRSVLDEIGGFEPIVNYLADDFQLGRRPAQAGHRVALSEYVVDVVLSGDSLRSVLARELRWSRTTKASRPWGHLGQVFTFGFVYALTLLPVAGFSAMAWSVLVAVTFVRAASAWVGSRKCLKDRAFLRRVYLLPLRDVLSFAIWVAGYFSRTVTWRGRRLRLTEGGRMAEI